MQTFLPYEKFSESAKVLDRQRLGKQRVETLQLLQALRGQSSGWINHPAAKMWSGYENALVIYGIYVCDEWTSRGYQDTCRDKIWAFYDDTEVLRPHWLGNAGFHAAHRSNLLRKDPVWYGQFNWTEPNNLPYLWPTCSCEACQIAWRPGAKEL